MAPRNPESIRQRLTVGQHVNRRVRLEWYIRDINSALGCIIATDIVVEGVIRAIPDGYGFSVLTDDGRSIGYFRGDYSLEREERMPDEYRSMRGFDGRANMDYVIVPLGEDVIPRRSPDEGRYFAEGWNNHLSQRVIYCSHERVDGSTIPNGIVERYRAFIVDNNCWVEITCPLMGLLRGDGQPINIMNWYPQGLRLPTFYSLFDAAFPESILGIL